MRGFSLPTERTATFTRDGSQFEAYAGSIEIGLPTGPNNVARACFSPRIDPPHVDGNPAIVEVSLIGFVIPGP